MADQSNGPVADRPSVRWGAATDVGMVRAGNEDAFVAEPMVFGVADGMGGHQAGEVASAIAARIVRDRLKTGASNVGVVVAAVVEANAAIYQAAHASADQHGMGTTLTALVVMRHDESKFARFALVNVGDSRTYLVRNGVLHRATVDHSYVQELVNTGHISEEEARNHPRRNIVTRALGIEPTVRVDTWLVPMVHGDRFILCSDGLVDEVSDDDIAEIALKTEDPQAAAEQLVSKANANGGSDNITVVVVDVLEGVEPSAEAELESEPGWPGSDSTTTMVDADAESLTAPGVIPVETITNDPITDQLPVTPPPPTSSPLFTLKRFLQIIGAAVLLTLIITVVAVIVHNSNTNDVSPTTTPTTPSSPAPTEPSTTSSTSSTTSTSSTSSTSTSVAGTTTLGP